MESETTVVDGAVDYKSLPVSRFASGGWRSAAFIISVEIAERFAYYGIGANLISYLTGPLGQSTAAAAAGVNAWAGTASLLPLLGAFVADSFLGRYLTILAASGLYILALGLLTLSAILLSVSDSGCKADNPCSPPVSQVVLFFSSLYLVALAQAGHKPCTQAFGADQFDDQDQAESQAKSSFFNWWYFGVCAGGLVTTFVVSYVQENLSWALGFGIPCVAMVFALVVFVLGTRTYRYVVSTNEKGPFARIGGVIVAAFRNRLESLSTPAIQSSASASHQNSNKLKFLNKASVRANGSKEDSRVCSVAQVEEAKAVLRLIPIWATCLMYGVVFAQASTFFTKQGATMERTIFPGFKIPAASLQCFISITILVFVPVYDRVLVPFAGPTMLQRIGSGIFVSILAMAVSALVEMKRLRTASNHGLVGDPKSTVPMSAWWLVPSYVLFGIADVFTMIGLQEFLYDQVPRELRSVGLALYLSIFGVGSFLSSFLVSVIDKSTGRGDGKHSWFSNDLNSAHLDYFYWLLSGLSALGFLTYLYFAKSYIYSR